MWYKRVQAYKWKIRKFMKIFLYIFHWDLFQLTNIIYSKWSSKIKLNNLKILLLIHLFSYSFNNSLVHLVINSSLHQKFQFFHIFILFLRRLIKNQSMNRNEEWRKSKNIIIINLFLKNYKIFCLNKLINDEKSKKGILDKKWKNEGINNKKK